MRPKRSSISTVNLLRRGVPKSLHLCTLDDLELETFKSINPTL